MREFPNVWKLHQHLATHSNDYIICLYHKIPRIELPIPKSEKNIGIRRNSRSKRKILREETRRPAKLGVNRSASLLTKKLFFKIKGSLLSCCTIEM